MSSAESAWGWSEGDQINESLIAMKLLGGGSSYEAYVAFDEETLLPVVVKVVRPALVQDESTLRGLRREVEALSVINHPVLVRGLRHEVTGPLPHVVLEHIDGPRLSSLIRRYGALPEQQYIPLAVELSAALHYFRRVGWVHLDIKPSNVIMGAPVRLIDLSVARTTSAAAELTVRIGTDDYLSPEQCLPPHTGVPGPASDIWGLAATLFEAVSGETPFSQGDPEHDDVARRYPQLVDEPRDLPDRVPADVASLIRAGLDPAPANRPSPAEFAEAWEPIMARQPKAKLTYRVR